MDVEKRLYEILKSARYDSTFGPTVQAIAALVREAVAEEREACARAATNAQCGSTPERSTFWDIGYVQGKRDAIEAIRARNPTAPTP